ncbi:MAG TPA: hypothetical protein VFQ38_15985 [Longimicrobiales bacterium]|nr:hypothetical protein [Longimicrobiales bacterium]
MRQTQRRLAVATLVVAGLPACAGSAGPRAPEPAAAGGEFVIAGQGAVYHVPVAAGAQASTRKLARGEPAVWADIPRTFAAAGLPVNLVDSRGMRAGTLDLQVRGSVGGVQVSAYLDCGMVAGALPAADAFLVTLSVVTTLRALAPDSTEARIAVTAVGKDVAGTNPDRLCSSTQRLERTLLSALAEASAAPAVASAPPAEASTAPAVPGADSASAAAGPRRGSPRLESPRRQAPPRPGAPLVLAAGGVAGGFIGVGIGSQIGKDCETRCLTARGTIGPLFVGSVLIPLGVHLANRGRGDFVKGLLVSAGWATIGGMAAGMSGTAWPVYAVAPGQLLTSLLIERGSTAH